MIRLTLNNGTEVYVNPAQILWLYAYTAKGNGFDDCNSFIAFQSNETCLYVRETPGEIVQMIGNTLASG